MGVAARLQFRADDKVDLQVFRETWAKIGIAREFFGFLWRMKMWWMMPVVVALVLMELLIGFGSASGVGPFTYTLF
jgi:hypothetical protein